MALTESDGKWRALDTMSVRHHLGGMEAIVDARVQSALSREFGVAWVPRPDGRCNEIAGITQEVMDAYSTRVDVGAVSRHRTEVVVGGVIFLNKDHDMGNRVPQRRRRHRVRPSSVAAATIQPQLNRQRDRLDRIRVVCGPGEDDRLAAQKAGRAVESDPCGAGRASARGTPAPPTRCRGLGAPGSRRARTRSRSA